MSLANRDLTNISQKSSDPEDSASRKTGTVRNIDTFAAPTPVKTGVDTPLPHGIVVGNAEDERAGTGCTVLLCPQGGTGAVAVRGGAPATRETDLLRPENMVQTINAIVLSGGSAYGLDASSGVMRYLEERKIGFCFKDIYVPIVCAASLFDLTVGDSSIRPNPEMGYNACESAFSDHICVGSVGAGCGASVGKLLGERYAMKGGLGAAGISMADGLVISAFVAVNAVGTVIHRESSIPLAGVLDPTTDGRSILTDRVTIERLASGVDTSSGGNTTIGCVVTSAILNKAEATRIASVVHDAFARAIDPVHTSNDGDTVFVLCTNDISANPDTVGVYATDVMEQAIYNAVLSAKGGYDLKAAVDLL